MRFPNYPVYIGKVTGGTISISNLTLDQSISAEKTTLGSGSNNTGAGISSFTLIDIQNHLNTNSD